MATPRPHCRAAPWPVWLSPFVVYAAPGPQALALWSTGGTHEPTRLWFRQRACPLSISQWAERRCPGGARKPAADDTAIASDARRFFTGRQPRIKAGWGIIRRGA